MSLVTDERVKNILETIRKSFGDELQTTQAIELSFAQIKNQLEIFLTDIQFKNQQYQNAYNAYIKTNTKYKTIKQIQQQNFGKELIQLLEQGYILLQGIREYLVGDVIEYKFVKQYSNQTIEYSMNLHQLLKYARQERFSTYTGELATLSLTMKGLIQYLNNEIQGQNLSEDPLFNAVMNKMGKVYEHNKLYINSANTLIESYYQLRNIGFIATSGNSLTKGIIYFYKMTQGQVAGYTGNLGQTLGGDSFLEQIKYNAKKTTSFNLINVNYLMNGLKKLIVTFSPPFNKEKLLEQLSSQFIQPQGPNIKSDAAYYIKQYANQLGDLVNKETNYLKSKVFNLKI